MAIILNIETATSLCSVALCKDGRVIAQRESYQEKSHASQLTVFIQDVFSDSQLAIRDIDAVAVGKGPGSYTGLRIGVSTAKGICYGINKPLISVSTMEVLCQVARQQKNPSIAEILLNPDTLLCPMIDARRMEVFTCVYSISGVELEPVSAKIIDAESFPGLLHRHNMIFFGSGMKKCRELLAGQRSYFIEDLFPHASGLAQVAEMRFSNALFEDTAYFEPFYLKDFLGTTPKKKLSI
jgi:tRNA threonylcarbamoyladenosine biosynthesis protein TsaB